MNDEYSYELAEPLLTVKDLAFSYDGKRNVIEKLDADVRNIKRPGLTQGQVIGILGESGGGKTTLFKLLAGQLQPDRGTILAGVKQEPVKRGEMGVVAQSYPLFEDRSVLSNMLLAARQSGCSRAEAKEKALHMLQEFGLEHQAESLPTELSGGQRQRAAIAQQLLCSNHFLLMDEPFSGQDLKHKEAACELISKVAATDDLFTIIVVSHDIPATVSVADHLWLLGPDRDDQRHPLGGVRIQHTFDLIKAGLAWHPHIRSMPVFSECEREVEERFRKL